MGLLNMVFGGGTKLDLLLDSDRIPVGGLMSGTVVVHGGKKPYQLNDVRVKLIYVRVVPAHGQTPSSFEMKTLVDNIIASPQPLNPGSVQKFAFTIPVPPGTDANGTYQALATADIPGVADPSATKQLKVMPAQATGFLGFAKGAAAMDAGTIMQRYPNLQSRDEWQLSNALNDLQCAAFDKDNNLIAIEPFLVRLMREGSTRHREEALRAWGTIMNDRATPQHIATLEAIALDPNTPKEILDGVVEVTAKFAEEGSMPLLRRFCQHPDPDVRRDVAQQIHWNVDHKVTERKPLLQALAQDQDASVRAAAYRAFSSFAEDPQIVQTAFWALQNDPSPDVHKACVNVISTGQHYGHRDNALNAFVWLLSHKAPEVRSEVANQIAWFPTDQRVTQIATQLLQDPELEVRKAMAYASMSMSDHPELAQLFMWSAANDPVREVRVASLEGVGVMVAPGDAVAFYRQRLEADASEATGFAVVNGLRNVKKHDVARQLLTELTQGGYAEVGRRAREMLAES